MPVRRCLASASVCVSMPRLDWAGYSTTLQGFIGLEVLFVICGFLAAITLIPLLEDRRRPVKQARQA